MAERNLISGFVSPDDLQSYERDGAICLRGVIDAQWVERLRGDIPAAIEGMLRAKEARGIARPEGPTHHDVLHLFKRNPLWKAFAVETPLPRIAADVTGAQKVILFADHLLVKEVAAAKPTPWHHDLPYWPIRGDDMCSIWVALDPVRKETGALEYIAGSHKWGKLFAPTDFAGGRTIPGGELEIIPDIEAQRSQHRIVTWDMELGDILVHHPLVVHGAGGNLSDEVMRRAISIRYTGENTRFVGSTLFGGNEGPFALPLKPGDTLDRDEAHPVAWRA